MNFFFYIAEKVSSIGKDWHRACLKCAKCGKTLASGSHAEVFQYMNINLDYGQRTLSLSFRLQHHSFNASIKTKNMYPSVSLRVLSVKITEKNLTSYFSHSLFAIYWENTFNIWIQRDSPIKTYMIINHSKNRSFWLDKINSLLHPNVV